MLNEKYQKIKQQVVIGREALLPKQGQHYRKANLRSVLKLLSLELKFSLIEFLVLITKSPHVSFKIVKQPEILNPDDASYFEHRVYHRKVRFFSLAGLGVVMLSTTILTLVLTQVLPKPRWSDAVTNDWVQDDWSGATDTAVFPVNPGDKTGWRKYYSKDSGITADASGISSSLTGITVSESSDSDFSAGTYTGILSTSGTGSGASMTLVLPQ